jgi:hypothetical protein
MSMSKHDREETNKFWWQRNDEAYHEYLQKSNQLLDALEAGDDSSPLIDWHLEQYVKLARDVNGVPCPGVYERKTPWVDQLRYMTGTKIGEMLLRRAGIEPLSLSDQVRFHPLKDSDPRRDEYLDYVEQSMILWTRYLEARKAVQQ